MNELFVKSQKLLSEWKSDKYIFGRGVMPQLGRLAVRFGKNALVVCNTKYLKPMTDAVICALNSVNISLAGNKIVPGARPNTPQADVYRIETYILHYKPDMIIAVGGGSTLDACKAANFLAVLGGLGYEGINLEIDNWFGTGIVSDAINKTGKKLLPLIAVATSASSGAHLTKYSNITDTAAGQKKLVVDEAIVPNCALFDYNVTASMPVQVTIDGAMDAISHCFEVFSGLPSNTTQEKYDLLAAIAGTAVELTIQYAPRIINDPNDMEAREAIGMATDLGGYAIMLGGTHGPHMNSFSLVDLTGHGTACGLMNPYYAVFFAPAIEKQIRFVGNIFKRYGYITENLEDINGRDLGIAFARGMISFGKAIKAPTTLQELPKWNDDYINKILSAAKDPLLDMKLKNMPVPLCSAKVDEFIGPIIRAAVTGDLSKIKSL